MSSEKAGMISSSGVFTTVIDGKVYTVNPTHTNYSEIIEAWRNNRFDEAIKLIDVSQSVQNYIGSGGVTVEGGTVKYRGKVLHHVIVDRIIKFMDEDLPFEYLVSFLEELMKNSSQKAIEESYQFLEKKNLPITNDGHFLAYKVVRPDFYSKSSGKLTLLQGQTDSAGRIFNGVGQTIECERREVDDDRDVACSKGLHVGALDYSGPDGWYYSNGDKVLIVKVNPKDIVAVPKDHSYSKVRVCKYKVLELYANPLPDTFLPSEEDEFDDGRASISVADLWIGDEIDFDYNGERRFMRVEDFVYKKDAVFNIVENLESMFGFMVYPDRSTGGYRQFKVNEMLDIRA